MIARLLALLRGLLDRRRIDGEIDEELRDHVEREVEAHRRRGVPPDEARRLALRDLGGLTQTIESTRDVPVQVDGEAAGHTPVDIELLDTKLTFIVPPPPEAHL